MGEAFICSRGGGAMVKSMIIVTVDTGSTVTCSNGIVTKTATEKNGVWTFKGLDLGTWTIIAELNGSTSEYVVVIERLSIEYVTMTYGPDELYLYNVGDKCDDVTGGWKADGVKEIVAAKYVNIQAQANASGTYLTENEINVTGYNKLIYQCSVNWTDNSYIVLIPSGVSDWEDDSVRKVLIDYDNNDPSTATVLELDISDLKGNCKIGIGINGSGNIRNVYMRLLKLER